VSTSALACWSQTRRTCKQIGVTLADFEQRQLDGKTLLDIRRTRRLDRVRIPHTMAEHRETNAEMRSRENLRTFIRVSQQTLQQVFDELRNRWAERPGRTIQNLDLLREHAFQRVAGPMRRLEIGLSKGLSKSLSRVGLLGEELRAKLELLWEYLQNGTLGPILKTLNSILGSLADVFGFAEVLKEFKENMEVAVDSLGPEGEPITIKLGLLPSLI